ncbi:response regulator [Pseudomonas oryzihabitans]|uniref:response regulator n=1 Tax=Pseudomonas oryzihabitans TaxID=47885 RepID=UPI00147630CF|nr:response regulator [Pseudomonas oryzihabitans]NMZ64689.1 response regulator [Pseudomonas oryzihabitans]
MKPRSLEIQRQILVLEDDPGQRELLTEILTEQGLNVVAVASSDEAMAHMDTRGSDTKMVIADVNVPGMLDGLAFAQLAAVSWPTVPFIIISGYIDQDLAVLPRRAAFLPKPWSVAELSQLVESLLPRR